MQALQEPKPNTLNAVVRNVYSARPGGVCCLGYDVRNAAARWRSECVSTRKSAIGIPWASVFLFFLFFCVTESCSVLCFEQ